MSDCSPKQQILKCALPFHYSRVNQILFIVHLALRKHFQRSYKTSVRKCLAVLTSSSERSCFLKSKFCDILFPNYYMFMLQYFLGLWFLVCYWTIAKQHDGVTICPAQSGGYRQHDDGKEPTGDSGVSVCIQINPLYNYFHNSHSAQTGICTSF